MTLPAPEDLSPVSDALSEEGLRAAGSLKWTRYGAALGAFVAEMDLPGLAGLPGAGPDGPAGDFFLERAGVALVDGADCGAPGRVRLNFATPRPLLTVMVGGWPRHWDGRDRASHRPRELPLA